MLYGDCTLSPHTNNVGTGVSKHTCRKIAIRSTKSRLANFVYHNQDGNAFMPEAMPGSFAACSA